MKFLNMKDIGLENKNGEAFHLGEEKIVFNQTENFDCPDSFPKKLSEEMNNNFLFSLGRTIPYFDKSVFDIYYFYKIEEGRIILSVLTESERIEEEDLLFDDKGAVIWKSSKFWFGKDCAVASFNRYLYKKAVKGGVKDNSYSTNRYGWIGSFSGETEIDLGGLIIIAKGYGTEGSGDGKFLYKGGGITFHLKK